jgi:hypothetical protein
MMNGSVDGSIHPIWCFGHYERHLLLTGRSCRFFWSEMFLFYLAYCYSFCTPNSSRLPLIDVFLAVVNLFGSRVD